MIRIREIHVGLFCLALAVQSFSVYGQSIRFSSHYDHDNGAGGFLNIVPTEDGFVAQGTNFKNGVRQSHTVKVDSEGQLLAEHAVFDVQVGYESFGLLRLSTGGLVSAGSYCDYNVPSPGYCDFYFARLDETGDTLFTKVISRPDTSDLLLSMVETRPNKIMLIGWTYNDTTNADADLLFITVDTLGNEVNRVVWGGGGTDYVHSGIVINEEGEVFMTGGTKSFGGNDYDTWLVKTDSVGNVLWQVTYNSISSGGGGGTAVLSLPDGNYAIVGGVENTSTGNSDALLMKVNPIGGLIWVKKFIAPNGSNSFWSGAVLEDGSIVASGQTTNTSDGSQAGWLVKTDANGDTLWTRTYNPSGSTDLSRSMLVMPNGDIVMVGFGRGENSTTQDGWILRVDSMGCLVENCYSVGVEEMEETGIFSVYPNPAQDVLKISVQNPKVRIQSVSVVDMLGHTISSPWEGAGVGQLDVSSWPDGIYLITLTDEDGNRFTERLVVRH